MQSKNSTDDYFFSFCAQTSGWKVRQQLIGFKAAYKRSVFFDSRRKRRGENVGQFKLTVLADAVLHTRRKEDDRHCDAKRHPSEVQALLALFSKWRVCICS